MITVAIIGAGIGAQHLAGYLELPELFRVKTICDLDKARSHEAIAAQMGRADTVGVSTDFATILSDSDIDVIDVCLPPHLHLTASKAALKAGKHVICEKPMATSLKGADDLLNCAVSNDRILAPVFQYRFGPAMSQLRALNKAGLLGRPNVAAIETHWNRGEDYYAVPWRGTWSGENGGAVLGHAIHNHDLLTHLFGPISSLSAFTTTRINDIEVEDCAAISAQMANGAVATSSITLGSGENTTRIKLVFEHLTGESGTEPYAPMDGAWTFTARNPVNQPAVEHVLSTMEPVQAGYAGFFEHFALAIANKENHAVTAADGRQSIELVTAIYHANKTQLAVSLPLGNAHPFYNGWQPDQHSG